RMYRALGHAPIGGFEIMSEFTKLDNNVVVRKSDAEKYFGLKSTAIDDAIASGFIPRPYPLGGGDSRAVVWFGHQINEFQQKVRENRDAWERERKEQRHREAVAREATKRVRRRRLANDE